MQQSEHRIYFSSSFCEKERFLVNLPFSLDLRGDWKCGVKDIFITSTNTLPNYIYILGDFCETSIVYGIEQLPVLRKLFLGDSKKYHHFEHPFYIPLKQKHLNKFELCLIDSNFKKINFGEEFLIECTLHFYKYG